MENNVNEITYSIQQLEIDLENRIQDFIKKGANEVKAKKLAWNEFPEKDKIALEILKIKLELYTNYFQSSSDE